MLTSLLSAIGAPINQATDAVGSAVAPDADDSNQAAVAAGIAALMGLGLAFVFRKKLMKPVIRYRTRRAARRTYRRTYRARK